MEEPKRGLGGGYGEWLPLLEEGDASFGQPGNIQLGKSYRLSPWIGEALLKILPCSANSSWLRPIPAPALYRHIAITTSSLPPGLHLTHVPAVRAALSLWVLTVNHSPHPGGVRAEQKEGGRQGLCQPPCRCQLASFVRGGNH